MHGLRVLRVRPFSIIGPRKTRDACSDFARGIVAVECGDAPSLTVGNLQAVRDFLDVEDAVRVFTAIVYALVAGWLGSGSGRRYWLAGGAAIFAFLSSQPFYLLFSGYSAGTLGSIVLLPLFVLLLLKNHAQADVRLRLLLLLLVPALTVTHFNSVLLALLLAATSTVWGRRSGPLTVSFAVLAAVVIACWDVLTPFNGIVYAVANMSREAFRTLVEFEPGVLQRWFLPVHTTQYTQESQPLWARVAWQAWTAAFLLLCLGAVLAKVRAILGRRRLEMLDYLEVASLASVGSLSLIWLLSSDVENMVNRALMASPWCSCPCWRGTCGDGVLAPGLRSSPWLWSPSAG